MDKDQRAPFLPVNLEVFKQKLFAAQVLPMAMAQIRVYYSWNPVL
jgi:hypothetical protein